MDVTSTIRFLKPSLTLLSERAYTIRYRLIGEDGEPVRKTNYEREPVNVQIHDMRPMKDKLSLEREGFAVLDLEFGMTPEEYFDRETVRERVIPRLRPALSELLGAKGLYFNEVVVRTRDLQFMPDKEEAPGEDKIQFNGPIPEPHADCTVNELHRTVELLLGEPLPEGARVQALNVWFPLKGPLQDWPLAFCDTTTVSLEDYHVHDGVLPKSVLESYRISYNPKQKWYYLSNQLPSEVFVFNTSDSAGICRPVPHTAFDNPNCPPGEEPRRSIELRVLAVY